MEHIIYIWYVCFSCLFCIQRSISVTFNLAFCYKDCLLYLKYMRYRHIWMCDIYVYAINFKYLFGVFYVFQI